MRLVHEIYNKCSVSGSGHAYIPPHGKKPDGSGRVEVVIISPKGGLYDEDCIHLEGDGATVRMALAAALEVVDGLLAHMKAEAEKAKKGVESNEKAKKGVESNEKDSIGDGGQGAGEQPVLVSEGPRADGRPDPP